MEEIIKTFKTDRIINAIKNYGSYGKLYMPERVYNNWNADLKGLYWSEKSNKLYVIIYVQGIKTDEDTEVNAREFFQKGRYSGTTDYHNFRFSFDEDEKKKFAEVIVKHIIDLENGLGDKQKTIERLTNWKLTNPVVNYFYDKYRMKYIRDWHKSNDEITTEQSYYHAKSELDKKIKENWEKFAKMTDDDLHKEYMSIFEKAYNDFRKDFNASEYRKEHYLF